MKIALVHDDLVQWGGAERVLLGISEVFPDAPIYTSVFDRDNEPLRRLFVTKDIRTSFLQKTPGWRTLYKTLLPFYPLAFERFDFSEYDLVISHTTRFAKSIITKPETTHICYMHSPPRFLWHLPSDPPPLYIKPLLSFLRILDNISSNRVDLWLSGSVNCQERIKKFYKKKSKVLYPFIDLDKFKDIESFDGNYYLIITRLNAYKRVDITVKAFNKNKEKLKIIGSGGDIDNLKKQSGPNIEFLGNIGDDIKIQLLSGCKALIVSGEEDLGLTPIEAQILGKPVVAFGQGGVLETVINKKTGIFFKEQNENSLQEALNEFKAISFDPIDCINNAEQFSFENFKKKLLQEIKI